MSHIQVSSATGAAMPSSVGSRSLVLSHDGCQNYLEPFAKGASLIGPAEWPKPSLLNRGLGEFRPLSFEKETANAEFTKSLVGTEKGVIAKAVF